MRWPAERAQAAPTMTIAFDSAPAIDFLLDSVEEEFADDIRRAVLLSAVLLRNHLLQLVLVPVLHPLLILILPPACPARHSCQLARGRSVHCHGAAWHASLWQLDPWAICAGRRGYMAEGAHVSCRPKNISLRRTATEGA